MTSEKLIIMNFQATKELRERFKKYCNENGYNMSLLIRLLIRQQMNKPKNQGV